MATTSTTGTTLRSIALAIGVFVLVAFVLLLIAAIAFPRRSQVQTQFLCLGIALTCAAALASFCLRVDNPQESLLFGRWRAPARFYLYGLLVVVAIRGAGLALAPHPRPIPGDYTTQLFEQVGRSAPGIVVVVLVIAGLIPVIEELMYRRALYTWLARIRPWVGTIGSTVIFAATHPAQTVALAFIFGLAAAQLYARSRSLWPAIACHALLNASGIAIDLALVT